MTSVNEVLQKLEHNFKSVYIEGVKILLKFLENIVNHPQNDQFRKILVRKILIKQKLLILNGIESVLESIGYTKTNDGNFVLPLTVTEATVQKYRDYFYTRLAYVIAYPEDERESVEVSTLTSVAVDPLVPQYEIPGRPDLQINESSKVLICNNENLKFLEELSDRFVRYEDKELQEFTRRHIIPMELLKSRVIEKISKIQRLIKSNKLGNIVAPNYDAVFLIDLLNWFNTSFFQWRLYPVECKVCSKCNDKSFGVENHIKVEYVDCCGQRSYSYLHDNISQLLKSRRGRSQEFASCFTFICRCLDYEARYVHGDFGYAWTEIFMPSLNQWIHFDPSKNIYNSPLIYQFPCREKITYVVAVSVDDIQNVTRRYVLEYDRAQRARKDFKERELSNAIRYIRQKRQQNLSIARKSLLNSRNTAESIWLNSVRQITTEEREGRSSILRFLGHAWNLCGNENNVWNGKVFELTNVEIKLKQFALRYSCINDVYERYNRNTGTLMERNRNWQTCLYECENIHKMESNLVMLYRRQACDYSRVEWKFDFSSSGLRIKEAFVKFVPGTFDDGEMINFDVWFQHESGIKYKTTAELKDSQKFSIIIEAHGKLDFDYTEYEIFAKSSDSKDYPFEVFIQFY